MTELLEPVYRQASLNEPQNERVHNIYANTQYKYAINQVTQCESEPQPIETTKIIATLYSKARATTLTGYKFTATFYETKVHCSQASIVNKNRLDHESF